MKYRNSSSNMAAANTFEVVKETQETEHADGQTEEGTVSSASLHFLHFIQRRHNNLFHHHQWLYSPCKDLGRLTH
jgi:hypothetical protein